MKSEWRKVKLKDLTTDGKGSYGIGASAVPYNSHLYRYLRITDINDDGTIDETKKVSVDEPNADSYILAKNDIVFARTGASTGRSYFHNSDEELVYAGFLIKFSICPDKVNPQYIKYYALSQEFNNWVGRIGTGSTRPNINAQTYGNLEIPIPPRRQQDFLADTLSCLDAKIELNNKINENLEAQAQAVFKSWFVDFEPFQDGEFVESELGLIPKGWRVGKLEEIGEITMGQSPKGSTYNELGDGKVFYQGRAEFGWRFPTRRLFTTDPKRMANENDILMSVRAPVGDINIAYEECCIGRGLASIRNAEYTSFLLYTMQAIHQRLNQFNAEGTVFGSINQGELRSMKVIIPPESFICKFEDTVEFCDKEIRNLSYQNTTLAALRDTLLPKLMSGEVEVPVTQ